MQPDPLSIGPVHYISVILISFYQISLWLSDTCIIFLQRAVCIAQTDNHSKILLDLKFFKTERVSLSG
ncbi:hypothetical protein DLD82_09030 [Methanospirillum stamsii]|uniref:Uncharacterized protein n=1 Tax=Methanospirillum stamsii TaxID=1277351 RepID=A0A2V2NAN3_9EURY|nr:hypothetical protein DLD82_09030 [Methanospirillum stamsii]